MKTDDKTTTEQADQNNDNGDKSESFNILERARQEREGLAKENERLERNLRELREIETSRLLGSSAGGRVEPQPPKQETDKEYSQRIKQELAQGKYNG